MPLACPPSARHPLSSSAALADFTSIALPKAIPNSQPNHRATVACTTCRTHTVPFSFCSAGSSPFEIPNLPYFPPSIPSGSRKIKCTGTKSSCSSCEKNARPCSYQPVSFGQSRSRKERKASKQTGREDAVDQQRLGSLDSSFFGSTLLKETSKKRISQAEDRPRRGLGAFCSSSAAGGFESEDRRHTMPAVVGTGGVTMERSMARSGGALLPTGWTPPSHVRL
jgi:hypothetical protein